MGSGFCNRSHDGMTCVAWQLPSDEDNSPFHVGFIASLLVVVFFFRNSCDATSPYNDHVQLHASDLVYRQSVSLQQVFRAALSSENDVFAGTGVKCYCLGGTMPRRLPARRLRCPDRCCSKPATCADICCELASTLGASQLFIEVLSNPRSNMT